MKKALLVIDMQNVCVGEMHATYFKYNNSSLIQEVNRVIDANEKNLVVYIMNVMKKSLLNKFAPFHAYEGSEEIALVKELHIIGVDGGGCVALTALGAIKEGYKVIVNETAIGTMFDKNKDKYFKKLRELGAEFI